MRLTVLASLLGLASLSIQPFTADARAADIVAANGPADRPIPFVGPQRPRMLGQSWGTPSARSAPLAAVTATPVFNFLDYPGTSYTTVFAINSGAVKAAVQYIVGSYGSGSTAPTGTVNGFLIHVGKKNSATTYSFYPVAPAGQQLYVFGVNDDLEMVGYTTDANPHGFMIRNRVYTQFDVPFPGAMFTAADAVNNAGVITGYWGAADGTQHGFTLDNGVFSQVPDYPGSLNTNILGINNSGDLSGNVTDSAGVTHGFLLRNGVYTLFDPPGSVYTIGAGLNDSDEVVGFYCTSVCSLSHPSVANGFIYQNGTFTTIDLPGAPATELIGVNNAGLIVGYYQDGASGFYHGFSLTQK